MHEISNLIFILLISFGNDLGLLKMGLPQWPDSIFLLPHDFPDKYYFSLTPTLDAKWWLLVLLIFVGGGL